MMESEEKAKEEGAKGEKIEEKTPVKSPSTQKNPWMISTVVLGIIIIIGIFFMFRGGGITGNVISETDAGTKLVDFLNGRTGGGVELISAESEGNLYKVTVSYQGSEIPVYITKDGKYFVQGVTPITATDAQDAGTTQQQPSTEVPKSDKPKVELFIWSYCPYGVQAQGPLADVAKLLEDYADFETVLYYDGHGPYETQENKIQACIQEVDPDKYWDYASSFVDDIYPKCGSSRDIECDEEESIKLMKSLGIDDSEVMDCVEEKGEDLIAEHSERAREYGVTGSPSLLINGVKVNTARTAEAFKTAICDAFNDAPEDCSETLDSSAAAAASGNC